MTDWNDKLSQAAKDSLKATAPKSTPAIGEAGADLGDTAYILVHKQDCEGALKIGNNSGAVYGDLMERPDWSAGLLVALLAERQLFWESRLGKSEGEASRETAIAFEDLGWIVLDEDGSSQYEVEASAEFRMDAIASALGFERHNDIKLGDAEMAKLGDHGTLAFDADVSEQELRAIEEAQSAEFTQVTGTHDK